MTNIVIGTGNASTCTIGGITSKLSHDLTHQSHLLLIIFSAVWFWVVFSVTTIIGIISGVCVCCFCCSCCIVAAKRKNRTQQGRVLYTTPTAYQQGTTPNNYWRKYVPWYVQPIGAVYTNQTSPYAAPSTSSSNIYSTPYGDTQQTNSQFGSPPAYDNSGYSSYTNPDSSAVNQKYWAQL